MARLVIQANELLKWADLPQERREDILTVYDGMKNRLLKCHEAYDRLYAPLKENLEKKHYDDNGTLKSLPFLIGLQEEVETILYEQKNFLRDLLRAINVFFDTEFSEASVFYYKKKGDTVIKWAKKRFGIDDPFSKMLTAEQSWVEEIIQKRNAVEHPGGRSGTLHIQNFVQAPDGRFVLPVWHRDGMKPTGIFQDIEIALDNSLTLAEDILVSCIVHKNKFGEMISFAEIPEQKRDPKCPQRLMVVKGEALRKQP